MGSGETTPTMAKPHRELFARMGPEPVPAVVIDTPYGFQANAEDISTRAVSYFRETVGRRVEVASLLRAEGASALTVEAALARIGEARWVFAGPGSPTYALRQWKATSLPRLLADKLDHGGCLVFSSAAALTLGHWTVPVYEVYKVGADPSWVDGLGLLAPLGLEAAVIPHYDNAEGGTHDTRFCYLGEPRLRALEAQLPPEAWVLGVDEHTVCVLDFDAGTATVGGLGGVTVRRHGTSTTVPAGESVTIADLVAMARGARPGARGATGTSEGTVATSDGPAAVQGARGAAVSPNLASRSLTDEARRLSAMFDTAVADRDAGAATGAALELEEAINAWSADTAQSDERDRARAGLRRMVLRLGELAAPGLREPAAVVGPWVEALLAERAEARQGRRFSDSDRIRGALTALGIEVRDTPTGTEWGFLPAATD
jgi:hypothetical protein